MEFSGQIAPAVLELCRELGFAEEVSQEIFQIAEHTDFSGISEDYPLLFEPEKADAAVQRISQALPTEKKGLELLTVMLIAALETRRHYKAKGIPDTVFLDTMDCFPRFTAEHKESFGCWGFDRGFWAWRQLSGRLFRLGTLEYELCSCPETLSAGGFTLEQGAPALSVHIPSNASLEDQALEDSFAGAREFFPRYFPEFGAKGAFCQSWLLSANLRKLLGENSRIRHFQDRFLFVYGDDSRDHCQQWLFKRTYENPADFPEDTSLQRSAKAFILSGGILGGGTCILPPDVFPG